MPATRALALNLVAVAALLPLNVHAQEKINKSLLPAPEVQVYSPLMVPGGKQPCAPRAIWCPDDYCRKCPPCICLPRYCGTPDCYDAKCPPCICLPRYCGALDCYDPKCPPCVKIPCIFPSIFKCPPPKRGGFPALKAIITK